MLSSESRKFFRNAIVMSGTAESIWSMSNEKNHINIIYELFERSGDTNKSLDHIIEILKSASPRYIVSSVSYFEMFFGTAKLKFAPIIESIFILIFFFKLRKSVYFYFECREKFNTAISN